MSETDSTGRFDGKLRYPSSLEAHVAQKELRGTIDDSGAPKSESSKTLIIVLHGILSSRTGIKALEDLLLDTMPSAELWSPELPYGRGWLGLSGAFLSCEPLGNIVKHLADDLDTIWTQGQYDELKIVAHSMGGIVARRLLLEGLQRRSKSKERRHWSEADEDKDRLVLLAAVNKGTGLTRHMEFFTWIGAFFGRGFQAMLFGFFNRVLKRPLLALKLLSPDRLHKGQLSPTVMAVARGSVEMMEFRLNWVIEQYRIKIPIVQLLGSVDDIVGPDDTIDLVTGGKFHYFDVPNTGHGDIVDVMPRKDEDSALSETKRLRWRKIRTALMAAEGDKHFDAWCIQPWGLAERPDGVRDGDNRKTQEKQMQEPPVKELLFVLHGIRDEGHWTDKIARRARVIAGKSQKQLHRFVDSYGYFGMGPFLFPGVRWKKVLWFMEQYIEARAEHPDAERFHFVGHSNGTYILAKALETFKQCEFHNIVFAGSIVRTNYPWKELMEAKPPQAENVLNFVATHDWVVALFPRLFELLNFQDVGGAGHNGFEEAPDNPALRNVKHATGAHGAALKEGWWDEIAQFVDEGKVGENLEANEVLYQRTREKENWFRILLWLALVSVLALTAVVVVPTLIYLAVDTLWPYIEKGLKALLKLNTATWVAASGGLAALVLWRIYSSQRSYRRQSPIVRTWLLIPAVVTVLFFAANWTAQAVILGWRTAMDLLMDPSANAPVAAQYADMKLAVVAVAIFAWLGTLIFFSRKG
ncbi:MAG: alpha/beta hydrolase [Pseudomonadota bacterium]